MNKCNKVIQVLLIIIYLPFLKAQSMEDNFPLLEGSYLGQTSPGFIPEIFAPEIVSTELHEHSVPSFSPDGTQILWNSQFRDDGGFPKRVIESHITNGFWTEPDFFDAFTLDNSSNAFFSPDGKRIYFSSYSDGSDQSEGLGKYDIWYIEKSNIGWSSPVNLGFPINSPNLEVYATVTNEMTIYYLGEIDPENNVYGIFRSEFINGKYQTPELLPDNINTEYLDWTPFIDPDQKYLLFSSDRPGGYGNGDIYISYRNDDDSWTNPINLGPVINNDAQERFPYVSPDGKYLFYISNRLDPEVGNNSGYSFKYYKTRMNKHGNGYNDIYWVDVKILEDFKIENIR